MVSQRGSSYAALLALVGAAILTSAYADGKAALQAAYVTL